MISDFEFHYPKYLESKQAIDDRALNRHVYETLTQHFPKQMPEHPLRILEVGAGIGTMIERLINWKMLQFAEYTAVDIDPVNIATLPQRLSTFAAIQKFDFKANENIKELRISNQNTNILVRYVQQDFRDHIRSHESQNYYDVIISHAVLDILPLQESLNQLFNCLKPEGQFWFTLNYNGVTHFEPVLDPILDNKIEQIYNQSMDQRTVETGGSETGRKLFKVIPQAGGRIQAVGSSDWVIHTQDAEFNSEEKYLLQCILQMVFDSVSSNGEISSTQLEKWYTRRLEQIEDGSLIYHAHQLDFCGIKG